MGLRPTSPEGIATIATLVIAGIVLGYAAIMLAQTVAWTVAAVANMTAYLRQAGGQALGENIQVATVSVSGTAGNYTAQIPQPTNSPYTSLMNALTWALKLLLQLLSMKEVWIMLLGLMLIWIALAIE